LSQLATTYTPGDHPELRTWRARVFTATWLSYFGFYFCRKPFYVVKKALEDEHGWDPMVLGYIGTAYLVAYAIGQFVAGAAGHRTGPRILLLVGMAGTMVVTSTFGFVNSWQLFAVLMFIQGMAQASGWSGNVGAMAAWFHRGERGTVMGFWGTCYQVGGFLGTVLASFLLGAYGYRYAFAGGACVMLFVWVSFFFLQRDQPTDVGLPTIVDPPMGSSSSDDSGESSTQQGWTRDAIINVTLMGCCYFFLKFIRYALWSWAPYILASSFELEGDEAGFVSTIFDFAGIAGVILIGIASDRLFSGRRVGVSMIALSMMLLATGVMYVWGAANLTVFVLCMGLIGFTLYGPDSLISGAGAIDVAGPKQAVLAAGIINGLGSVGSVAQELVLGKMLGEDSALSAVVGVLVGSAAMSVVFLTILSARTRSGRCSL